MSASVESYGAYCAEWSRLLRLEFDASLGEILVSNDATEDLKPRQKHTFVSRVQAMPTSAKNVFRCRWSYGCREQFHVGETVWFSRSHPQRDCWCKSAKVERWSADEMVVCFMQDCVPPDIRSGLWRVDIDYQTFGLDWMLAALRSFIAKPEQPVQRLIVEDLNVAEGTRLETITSCPDVTVEKIEVVCKEHRLNDSQAHAVRASSRNCLTLVHGPPGTGKTQTIMAMLACFGLKTSPACSLSSGNLAVDGLCKRMIRQGMPVVRLGNVNSDKIDATLIPYCLETMAESSSSSGRNSNAKARRREWAREYIKSDACVACSTCTTVCADYLNSVVFSSMLIDEAGQATEPEVAGSFCRLTPGGKAVLVGDQMQLSCCCTSIVAADAGLQTSLFARLMLCPYIVKSLLEVQYRMHPTISKWPNYAFYCGRLRDACGLVSMRRPRGFPWSCGVSLAFVHVRGEEQASGLHTFCNQEQADVIEGVLAGLLKCGDVSKSDIGILTWYDAQKALLKSKPGLTGITISNVDGFQGAELPVMLLSTVRSNSYGNIGFTKSPNRMNVALTRAKRGMIVFGNCHTLLAGDTDGHWTSWFEGVALYDQELQRMKMPQEVLYKHKNTSTWHKEKKEVLCLKWHRYFNMRDVSSSVSEDEDVLKERVSTTIERLVCSVAWWPLCKFVLMLPKHKYGVEDRPSDFRLWDRKAWSHLNFILALGVQVDPGNVIFFLTLRFIVKKMRAMHHFMTRFGNGDWEYGLDRFSEAVSPEALQNMENGERFGLTIDGGDVLESIGGIIHPWSPQALALVQENLSAWRVEKFQIEELRYYLAMAIRRVKELFCYYRVLHWDCAVACVLEVADCAHASSTDQGAKRERCIGSDDASAEVRTRDEKGLSLVKAVQGTGSDVDLQEGSGNECSFAGKHTGSAQKRQSPHCREDFAGWDEGCFAGKDTGTAQKRQSPHWREGFAGWDEGWQRWSWNHVPENREDLRRTGISWDAYGTGSAQKMCHDGTKNGY